MNAFYSIFTIFGMQYTHFIILTKGKHSNRLLQFTLPWPKLCRFIALFFVEQRWKMTQVKWTICYKIACFSGNRIVRKRGAHVSDWINKHDHFTAKQRTTPSRRYLSHHKGWHRSCGVIMKFDERPWCPGTLPRAVMAAGAAGAAPW